MHKITILAAVAAAFFFGLAPAAHADCKADIAKAEAALAGDAKDHPEAKKLANLLKKAKKAFDDGKNSKCGNLMGKFANVLGGQGGGESAGGGGAAGDPKTFPVGKLTSNQIRKLLVGNTFDGENGLVYHAPGGKLYLDAKHRGGKQDEGTYEIKGKERYCRQFNFTFNGKKQCGTIHKKSDGVYSFINLRGEALGATGQFKVKKGGQPN